uniref:Uncharacterized protein n=1 Tax=Pristionchus pacificus TaxID=54126 RepID=A0A2A6CHR5_PRIPA|eukprot:PDM77630.1 hypothetical protein PRIPAC_34497 [Pristionchus pacificus]
MMVFFTNEAALFQLQVTGDAVKAPPTLALYQKEQLAFGCKFENGKVTLIDNIGQDGKNLTQEYKMSLFEDRSRFKTGHVLCAIKVERALKLATHWVKTSEKIILKLQTDQAIEYKSVTEENKKFFEATDIIKCDPYSFKNKISASQEFQVLQVINRDKDVMSCVNDSYVIRYEHTNGDRGVLDKLECTTTTNADGTSKYSLSIQKIDEVCREPNDCAPVKECRDPKDCAPRPECPVYKAGAVDQPATLTCPGNKWMIDGEYAVLNISAPVCKKDTNHNQAAFHFKLPSGWRQKQGARCFEKYDCHTYSKLIYSCLDESKCVVADYSNGTLKCPPENTLTIFYNHQVLNESISYKCNTTTGQYQNGSVIIERRSRVSCIGVNITFGGKEAETSIDEPKTYLIIGGVCVGVIALIAAAFIGFQCLRRHKSKVVVQGREAFRKWKRKKRIDYCKKAFSEILLSTAETHANILAGLNLIDTMLAVGADDRECWEEASAFLRRLQGTIQRVDVPIWHMLSRYLVIQAAKIIDKHGWIAPKRIRKKSRKGLIRTVAIQLLSFAINDNKNAEAEDMIQSGFIKLGFDAVEQYPHCGLLWATILHTQPLAKQSKADKSLIATFHELNFAANLRTIVQDAVPKAERIPGFDSIAQQAAYALGGAPLPRTLNFDYDDGAGKPIFYQKENNDEGGVQRAFFKGLSETGTRQPGLAILLATGMWARNAEFMGKVCALAPPAADWVARVQHAMDICVYYGRFLDAKRLLDRFVPTAKDADDILSRLSQQQQDFEDAVEKSKEDVRAWLAKRTDRNELKQPPVCITNPKVQLDDRIQGDEVKNVEGSGRTRNNKTGGSATDREPATPESPASPAPAESPAP